MAKSYKEHEEQQIAKEAIIYAKSEPTKSKRAVTNQITREQNRKEEAEENITKEIELEKQYQAVFNASMPCKNTISFFANEQQEQDNRMKRQKQRNRMAEKKATYDREQQKIQQEFQRHGIRKRKSPHYEANCPTQQLAALRHYQGAPAEHWPHPATDLHEPGWLEDQAQRLEKIKQQHTEETERAIKITQLKEEIQRAIELEEEEHREAEDAIKISQNNSGAKRQVTTRRINEEYNRRKTALKYIETLKHSLLTLQREQRVLN